MSKRTVFTTISPLPPGIPRDVVLEFLHNHVEMIDLNPLVKERHPIKPPSHAAPEELNCVWYSLTDKISYLPGGLATGDVSYTCAFYDLPNGLQTHCYAPMGLDIRDKWTLAGSLPGEPEEPVELGLGAPVTGLYIREDIDMRCNVFMTPFVKKTLKKSHAVLVDHLKMKAKQAAAADPTPRPGTHGSIHDHRQIGRDSVLSWQQQHQRQASNHGPAGMPPTDYQQKDSYSKPQDGQVNLPYRPGNQQAYQSQQYAPAGPYGVPTPTPSEDSTSAYPQPLRMRQSSTGSSGQQSIPAQQPRETWQALRAQNNESSRYAQADADDYSDFARRNPYDEKTPQSAHGPQAAELMDTQQHQRPPGQQGTSRGGFVAELE